MNIKLIVALLLVAVTGMLRAEITPNPPLGVQPSMSRAEIEAGLKSHDRALYIREGWIRDPYITLGPDNHDSSLFKDDDGTWWFIWQNGWIAPLSKDYTRFTAEPVRLDPSGSRPGANGGTLSRIGHEGTTLIKIGRKYVFIGTAWSTDLGRKGSYNLYYCTSDNITGPYGPRQFLGRFLGHGTPFQTHDGKWWCTAFLNANVPPLPRDGIETRDLAGDAQTINQRGTTIVPLEVKILDDGDLYIRAIDRAYATPGPDEVQKFGK